ncbi:hypothetical protein RND81_04G078400 [Saponaria officinalis]|uniref:Uncharacterized protein n=1 Tax=Saponaria officinalis TaxID=3572 RepID=A0AAW1LDK3_SAPOF
MSSQQSSVLNTPPVKRNMSLDPIYNDSESTDVFSLIDAEMYMYLVHGNKDEVLKMGVHLLELKSEEDENSVLHIAACAGQSRLISDIIPLCKDIVKSKTCKGDTAFHCTAKSAQLDALLALMG